MSTTEPDPSEPVPTTNPAPQPGSTAPVPSPLPAAPPEPPAPPPPPPQPQFAPASFNPMIQPGYDPAFAPVTRAPKQRWINPQRRTAVTIIAVVAALFFLGIGALGGSLLTSHHDNRAHPPFQRGGFGRFEPQPGGRHTRPLPPRPTGNSSPTPTPSATS